MNQPDEILEDLVYMIKLIHKDALDQYSNFKEESLTIGMVEAEGYLRCAKTFYNHLVDNYPELLN